jgi:hypothetical protein
MTRLASLLILLAWTPTLALATTYVVKPDGTGDFPTIQAALDAASAGDSVVVSPGTYKGVGNRGLDFGGKDLVLIGEGGPQVTIIDCEQQDRGLYFHTEETNDAIVKGFTITNGVMSLDGGGIYCRLSSPSIVDCHIRRNSGGEGGGIACTGSSARVVDCLISENEGEGGGGLGIRGSNVMVERCTIMGNESTAVGGGLFVWLGSTVRMEDCVITGNVGGAALFGSTLESLGCTIAGNRSGGLFLESSTGTLKRSVLWGNCIEAALDGSSLYFECSLVDSSGVMVPYGQVEYGEGTIFEDPLFCGPIPCDEAPTTEGDYRVRDSSPCLPENNECGELIGALGIGCDEPTVTLKTTWGQIKARFGE